MSFCRRDIASGRGERPGAEERGRAFAGQAPVLDALGLVELARCDLVGHSGLLVTKYCCETVA